MKCPKCNMTLAGIGQKCPRCSSAARTHDAFSSLPPCYGCAGTGIVARGKRGFSTCSCPRGRWMRDNSILMNEVVEEPRSDEAKAYQPTTEYHPDLVARTMLRFPADPELTTKQRSARLKGTPHAGAMAPEPTADELLERRNAQIARLRLAGKASHAR